MPCDYPIYLDLAGRLAVVVGGGNVAARKVDKLLSAGARVRVVAPQVSQQIQSRTTGPIEVVAEPFAPAHLAGAFLAFACTNSEQVNASVAAAARSAGVLVNRTDDPAGCDFFVPAVSELGPVKLAISTGGASPALAKFLRKWLQRNLPVELAMLAAELARVRPIVQQRVARPEDRAAIWETLCTEESMELLAKDGVPAWQAWLEQVISRHSRA